MYIYLFPSLLLSSLQLLSLEIALSSLLLTYSLPLDLSSETKSGSQNFSLKNR